MVKYRPENEFIGNKIKSYRKKKKLTQIELAEKLGVADTTISAYERGFVEIPRSKLIDVAKALDVNHTNLLPIEEGETKDAINEHIQEAKAKLPSDQLAFLELLLAKTNSLDGKERERFLKNVKFAVKFFDEE
jgi:transcriptional regulator with XRE-family HTH domain